MKVWGLFLGAWALPFLALAEEETSAQRLENAQKGTSEAIWPKKPDTRQSSFSGKMKDFSEISPKFYGQDNEIRSKRVGEWQKNALSGPHQIWQGPTKKKFEEARWSESSEWTDSKRNNEKFAPSQSLVAGPVMGLRSLDRDSAPDWSSRTSSLGMRSDGSLRLYEGRLTRIREQVQREEQSSRELGGGRQEKFSPEEVKKILSQPPSDILH